mmetsp:Transcript_28899/g.69040  ORF Transcript_28899/g.69040 Transcript_28899/m.69040 type:complete len:412 (-) Transcript_28899:310-1545(-)
MGETEGGGGLLEEGGRRGKAVHPSPLRPRVSAKGVLCRMVPAPVAGQLPDAYVEHLQLLVEEAAGHVGGLRGARPRQRPPGIPVAEPQLLHEAQPQLPDRPGVGEYKAVEREAREERPRWRGALHGKPTPRAGRRATVLTGSTGDVKDVGQDPLHDPLRRGARGAEAGALPVVLREVPDAASRPSVAARLGEMLQHLRKAADRRPAATWRSVGEGHGGAREVPVGRRREGFERPHGSVRRRTVERGEGGVGREPRPEQLQHHVGQRVRRRGPGAPRSPLVPLCCRFPLRFSRRSGRRQPEPEPKGHEEGMRGGRPPGEEVQGGQRGRRRVLRERLGKHLEVTLNALQARGHCGALRALRLEELRHFPGPDADVPLPALTPRGARTPPERAPPPLPVRVVWSERRTEGGERR